MPRVKIELVVTRHPNFLTVLQRRGLIPEGVQVVDHATEDDVRDKHVLGILPYHLSCLCSSITEVPLTLTVEQRASMQRGDLSVEETEAAAGDPVTYVVVRVVTE